jgi:curved DNA-binding protein CbpA
MTRLFDNKERVWDPKVYPKLDFDEDYYLVLEISPTCTAEELKKGFYKMVAKYHPDNKQSEADKELANKQMMVINAAYRILKNPSNRMAYDRQRALGLKGAKSRVTPSARNSADTATKTSSTSSSYQQQEQRTSSTSSSSRGSSSSSSSNSYTDSSYYKGSGGNRYGVYASDPDFVQFVSEYLDHISQSRDPQMLFIWSRMKKDAEYRQSVLITAWEQWKQRGEQYEDEYDTDNIWDQFLSEITGNTKNNNYRSNENKKDVYYDNDDVYEYQKRQRPSTGMSLDELESSLEYLRRRKVFKERILLQEKIDWGEVCII